MTAAAEIPSVPVQSLLGGHDLPSEGRHIVRSPSKGVLVLDVEHLGEHARIVVSSPYYEGSTSFEARPAGRMVQVSQDSRDDEHGWRTFGSLAEFFEAPAGLRLDFFAFAIQKPGVPDYDSRN
jgi:hypothetical protein